MIWIRVAVNNFLNRIESILSNRRLSFLKPFYIRIRREIAYILTYKSVSAELRHVIGHDLNFYLFLVPLHGNLGDQSIVHASRLFIKDNFPKHNIIEISSDKTFKYSRHIRRLLRKGDVIALHGGGNMGNQYQFEEDARRFVIKMFNKEVIVSFPQTIYFTDSISGRKEYFKSRRIYSGHNDLVLTARESVSYDIMKKSFKNRVILTPDIVLYINEHRPEITRKDILICLRNDIESIISENQRIDLVKNIVEKYGNVIISDTIRNYNVCIEQREKELNKIWDDFRAAKLVVTDRLHGMIFSVITGTPCIVLQNYNHKIASEYEWIKDCTYIKLINEFNLNEILPVFEALLKLESINLSIPDFRDRFLPLKRAVSFAINQKGKT